MAAGVIAFESVEDFRDSRPNPGFVGSLLFSKFANKVVRIYGVQQYSTPPITAGGGQ
jgi:hypothetical protein